MSCSAQKSRSSSSFRNTGIGFSFAFDVYVAKHWFLGGGLRYVNVDSKFTIVDTMTGLQIYDNTLEMSPFMLSFGGGARCPSAPDLRASETQRPGAA